MIFRANVELVIAGPLVARDPAMISMRWLMLDTLETGGMTAAQLGRELGITRQGALLHVQFLEELGYVTLKDNAEDQRAKKVFLTRAGLAKLAETNRFAATWVNQLATHFDTAQIDQAVELLDKLRLLTLTSVRVLDEHASAGGRRVSRR